MDERTITEITEGVIGETLTWQVRMTDAEGKEHVHVFPQETLAWRAAEYGIDPADTDTLLDIILHEPFLPDLAVPAAAATDPAARAGLNASTLASKGSAAVEPVQLHNAPSTSVAREAHQLRIAGVKRHTRIRIPEGKGKEDPRGEIRARGVDPGRVAELAECVAVLKRQARGETAQLTTRALPPIGVAAEEAHGA